MKYVGNIEFLNRLECSLTLKPGQCDFNSITNHMLKFQRLSLHRIKKMLTTAGNLTQEYGYDFLEPDYEKFIRFMYYLEEVELFSPHMLKYVWQIQQKFLTAFNIGFGPGTLWCYKPPSCPPSKPRLIQTPDEMYDIVHTSYSDDRVMDAFLQYTVLHSCLFGWRNPSELCLLKTGDVDFDNHSLVVTEKKKHNRKRLLITDYPEVFTSRQIKSLRNWVDVWRPRIETTRSDDFLFITPCDGRPLRQMQYSRYITYYVNPLYPGFKPYNTRHFCATGLLIREKLNSGVWDKFVVKRWLGHERESTTDVYVGFAEQYMKICGFDWFKRILRQVRTGYKNNMFKPHKKSTPVKSTNLGNNALLNQNSPISFGYSRTKKYNGSGEKLFDENRFFGVVGFQPIFFFFSLESPYYLQQGVGDNGFGDNILYYRQSVFLVHLLSPRFCCNVFLVSPVHNQQGVEEDGFGDRVLAESLFYYPSSSSFCWNVLGGFLNNHDNSFRSPPGLQDLFFVSISFCSPPSSHFERCLLKKFFHLSPPSNLESQFFLGTSFIPINMGVAV